MKQILVIVAVFGFAGCTSSALADDVAAGKALYEANCLACHGDKGQGGVGKKLAGDAAYWDFAVFKRAVNEGLDDKNRPMKSMMPVFGKVGLQDAPGKPPSDDQIKNIQAYLKTFGPKQ